MPDAPESLSREHASTPTTRNLVILMDWCHDDEDKAACSSAISDIQSLTVDLASEKLRTLKAEADLSTDCEDCDHGMRGGKLCESCGGSGRVLIKDLLIATQQHVKELKSALSEADRIREDDCAAIRIWHEKYQEAQAALEATKTSKKHLKPSGLWVIQTSNNLGSFDRDDEQLFVDRATAEAEALRLSKTRYDDRSDYIVRSLNAVLDDAFEEAEYYAGRS